MLKDVVVPIIVFILCLGVEHCIPGYLIPIAAIGICVLLLIYMPVIRNRIKLYRENQKKKKREHREIEEARRNATPGFGVYWRKNCNPGDPAGFYKPHDLFKCKPSPEGCKDFSHYLSTSEVKPMPFCPEDPRKHLLPMIGVDLSRMSGLECKRCKTTHIMLKENGKPISFKDASEIMGKRLSIIK